MRLEWETVWRNTGPARSCLWFLSRTRSGSLCLHPLPSLGNRLDSILQTVWADSMEQSNHEAYLQHNLHLFHPTSLTVRPGSDKK